MANERFTDLPTTGAATLTDIICAVQGGVSGTSVQETLGQVAALMLTQTILNYPGDPNGHLAGAVYQLCWDSVDTILYVCTSTGTDLTAVWTVTGINGLVTPTQGGTGVSNPTAHTLPVAEGTNAFNFLGPLTNGQILIGSSGADPVAATIASGPNISVVNTAGLITISATGEGGFSWTHVTGTSQAMLSFNGYIADNAALVTLTLPTTSALGDEIEIVGKGAGGWKITYTTSQIILFGTSSTTITTGSLASTNAHDCVRMVCTVANTEWTVAPAPQGNLTVV